MVQCKDLRGQSGHEVLRCVTLVRLFLQWKLERFRRFKWLCWLSNVNIPFMITRKLTQKNIKLKRPQHSHLHYRNQPPSIHWNLIHNLRFGFRCKHLKSTGQSISDWHSPPNAIHNLSDWHSKFVPPAIRHWGFTLHLNPLSRSQCDGDRHDIVSVHYLW